jgi:hypothetical protein
MPYNENADARRLASRDLGDPVIEPRRERLGGVQLGSVHFGKFTLVSVLLFVRRPELLGFFIIERFKQKIVGRRKHQFH